MKKVAVILSGCGVKDGSEIHEAVLTLLNIDKYGVKYVCAAPDVEQRHVVNHLTGEEDKGVHRSVLVEAGRIARGDIVSLEALDLDEVDGVIFPGGLGAVKNFSNFSNADSDYETHPEVKAFIRKANDLKKPLGFICISPVIAADSLGGGVKLTIGNDAKTAAAIERKGAKHVDCLVDGVVVDEAFKVVSTPAYMLAKGIAEAEKGIHELVKTIVKWIS